MSIGEAQEAKKVSANDAFETLVGETLNQFNHGKIYDVIGKPKYERAKKFLQETLDKKSKE